jgi:hypothetical protein
MNRTWAEVVKAIGPSNDVSGMDSISGVLDAPLIDSTKGSTSSSGTANPLGSLTPALAIPVPQEVSSSLQVGDSGNSPLIDSMSRLAAGVEQLRLTAGAQVESVLLNTEAVSQNTVAQASKGTNSAVSTLSKVFSPILQMSGVGSLVSGIVNLFGGGGQSDAPAPLTPYAAPPKIYYEGVISNAAIPSQAPAPSGSVSAESGSSSREIQINVQAMDSRSFMDHSDEIASAVRDALLRAHPLNDLINEE